MTTTQHWRIYVPRLWGWVPWGVSYETERQARDALAQYGPSDGRVSNAR